MTDRSEIPAIARQAAAIITNSTWGRRMAYGFTVMLLCFLMIGAVTYAAAERGLSEAVAKNVVNTMHAVLALNGLFVMVAPSAEQAVKIIGQVMTTIQAIRLGKTPPPSA